MQLVVVALQERLHYRKGRRPDIISAFAGRPRRLTVQCADPQILGWAGLHVLF